MVNLVNLFKNWQFERRRKLFERLEADPKTGVSVMIQNRAMEMAMRMVMNWLDKKRILHCARCPSTESLRRWDTFYFCNSHFAAAQVIEKQKKQQPAKEQQPVAA